MKSICDYINEEDHTSDSQADDFFDEKMIKIFINQMNLVYKTHSSDTSTGLYLLLKQVIEQNSELKQSIIDACEDILAEFKK